MGRLRRAIALSGLLLAAAAHAQEWPAPDFARVSTDSTALNVTLVGQLDLEGEGCGTIQDAHLQNRSIAVKTSDLFVAGDYAYVASLCGRLHIVDISHPEALRKVAEVPTSGPVSDVQVSGDLAVLALQKGFWEGTKTGDGVVTLDVADPTNPQVLSEFPMENLIKDVGGVHTLFLYGHRAYLAHLYEVGLTILDLSDPTRPFISGHWESTDERFGNNIHDLFIRDGLAFLANRTPREGGLVILDLKDPDQPVTLSFLRISEALHSTWMESGYVYCNQEAGGREQPLHIIDVSDPRQPVEVRTFRADLPLSSTALGPHNPWAQDGLLYWAYYDAGLRVFDITVPDHPVEIGHFPTGSGIGAWGAQPRADGADGLVYVADNELGLLALRFHEPAHRIAQVALDSDAALAGQGKTVTMTVFTARSPRGILGKIRRVSGRFLRVENTPEWVLTDGGSGQFTGNFQVPVELVNGIYQLRAELEDEQGRLYRYPMPFSIFPPEDLAVLDEGLSDGWRLELKGSAQSADLDETGTVYHGSRAGAFQVEEAFGAWSVKFLPAVAVGPFGYALRFALHPGDVALPKSPSFNVGLYPGKQRTNLLGGAVDLAKGEWQVVEIPAEAFEVTGSIESVRFTGNFSGTFYLDDLSLVAMNPPPTATAVVEDHTAALPGGFSLEQNFPNPFNSGTVIRFTLLAREEVELTLYNLAGQRVATLLEGVREAGVHTLTWDGRDDFGQPLASGVHLYRLQTQGGPAETKKLVLLR